MRRIESEIFIESAPEAVWNVLTDFEKYPEWNPFILSLKGPLKEGARLTAFIQPPGQKGMTFKPEILICKKHEELRWLGRLWWKGIFDGEHYFILEKTADGYTNFHHGELFSGILVSAFKSVLAKTENGFEEMNKALKIRCENIEH